MLRTKRAVSRAERPYVGCEELLDKFEADELLERWIQRCRFLKLLEELPRGRWWHHLESLLTTTVLQHPRLLEGITSIARSWSPTPVVQISRPTWGGAATFADVTDFSERVPPALALG